MAEDRLDGTLTTIISVVLGCVFLCSFAIPTITGQLDLLTDAEAAKYGSLIGVVVICMIIGLILVVTRGYNNKR